METKGQSFEKEFLRGSPSKALASIIKTNKEEILRRWEHLARKHLKSVAPEPTLVLLDSLPRFVDELANSISAYSSDALPCETSGVCVEHAEDRARLPDWSLDEVLSEYIILEKVILGVVKTHKEVTLDEYQCVLNCIFHAMLETSSEFIRLRTEQEIAAKSELSAAEERYRLVVEGAKDFAIVAIDCDGRVVDWNSGAENLFSYTRSEAVGKDGSFIFTAEDKANGVPAKELREAHQRGKAEDERWHVKKDGSRFFATGLMNSILNGAGEVIGYVKLLKDQTQKRLLEEERKKLLDSERQARLELEVYSKRLRDLQQITEAAVSRTTSLENLLNTILGHIQAAFKSDTVVILLVSEDGQHLEVKAAYGLEENAVQNNDIPFGKGVAGEVIASGRGVIVANLDDVEVASPVLKQKGVRCLMAVPLRTKEKKFGVIHTGRITRDSFTEDDLNFLQLIADRIATAIDNANLYSQTQSALQNLKEERELRERFVATLAHDLRNPLTAAKTSTGIIRKYPERADSRERLLVRIEQNIDRADRMIRDLLDANRIRAGQGIPLYDIGECDLTEITHYVIEELSISRGNRFVVHAPTHVRGFWSREGLTRILENLCDNAVKYGDEKAPIDVAILAGHDVRLQVHNQGPAIPLENLEKLFEPFQRIQGHKEAEKKGWGLGLALVNALAKAHGGSVEIKSVESAGTTFTVTLPWDSRVFQKTNSSLSGH